MIQAWGVGAGGIGVTWVGLALVDVGTWDTVAVEAGVAGALEATVDIVAGGVGVAVVLAVWALVIIGTCESVAARNGVAKKSMEFDAELNAEFVQRIPACFVWIIEKMGLARQFCVLTFFRIYYASLCVGNTPNESPTNAQIFKKIETKLAGNGWTFSIWKKLFTVDLICQDTEICHYAESC